MKKHILLSIFFFVISISELLAQNYKSELDNLSKKYEQGEIDQYKYQKMAEVWRSAMKTTGGYPELPLSEDSSKVRYEFIYEADNLDKLIIYNRILEYFSLQYESLSEILDYQDYDLGKIIIKCNTPVEGSYTSFFCATYRFTIIQNKYRLEISNISYAKKYDMILIDETYFYDYLQETRFEAFYPVTNKNFKEWEQTITKMKKVDKAIKDSGDKIFSFVKAYNGDYEF
ncbi:MAG: DUF4468 domain-containing protein [Bacteroidales bacterium]|nr:DUF4468 domain-containing protein [Bacteroidales bacterium]MBN2818259.1 DUF4468 domain-containing protein [Bacteroidales bacterium]